MSEHRLTAPEEGTYQLTTKVTLPEIRAEMESTIEFEVGDILEWAGKGWPFPPERWRVLTVEPMSGVLGDTWRYEMERVTG